MIFVVINSVCSVFVAAMITYKLVTMSERLIFWERLGLGLLAGGMVLNIAPILRNGSPLAPFIDTPFDDWGSTVLRIGLLLYLYGRISRVWIHDKNNALHAREIERDLADRRRAK